MAYRLYLDWLSLHQVIAIRLTLSWPGPKLLDIQMAFSGAGMVPCGVFFKSSLFIAFIQEEGDVADKDTILKGFLLSSHVNIKYLK